MNFKNFTNYHCSFLFLCHHIDTLGEVEAFQQPQLSYNTTTITVSWSPPWSHLVNNYTVTMNNLSTNTWIVNYLNNDETTWRIHNFIAHPSQCDRLRLFVTAFTDIGETKSKIIEAGFPIGRVFTLSCL